MSGVYIKDMVVPKACCWLDTELNRWCECPMFDLYNRCRYNYEFIYTEETAIGTPRPAWCPVMPIEDYIDMVYKECVGIVHTEINKFFDYDSCGPDEDEPLTEKDKLLLKVNKAICNAIHDRMKRDE